MVMVTSDTATTDVRNTQDVAATTALRQSSKMMSLSVVLSQPASSVFCLAAAYTRNHFSDPSLPSGSPPGVTIAHSEFSLPLGRV